MSNRFRSIEDRYEEHVVRTSDGCWGWSGALNTSGYPRSGKLYAHRLSYLIHHGPIPDGLYVLHSCDNPPCTNPDHLSLGTQTDNMADANSKGRLDGAPSVGQKLTIDQAREIRRLYGEGVGKHELAARYGIHPDTARRIGTRILWASA